MPASNAKEAVARVLKDEGYITDYSVAGEGASKQLSVELKYFEGVPVIEKIQRASRPGLRVYRGKEDLPKVLGGLGVGASSVAAPMYISEISPANRRGRLVAMFQFNVVFGIVIAYISNYFIAGTGPNAWRWMLGVEAVPAILFLVLVLKIPRTGRRQASRMKGWLA